MPRHAKRKNSATPSIFSTWTLLLFALILLYTPRDGLQSSVRKHRASTTPPTALSKALDDMLYLIWMSSAPPFNKAPAEQTERTVFLLAGHHDFQRDTYDIIRHRIMLSGHHDNHRALFFELHQSYRRAVVFQASSGIYQPVNHGISSEIDNGWRWRSHGWRGQRPHRPTDSLETPACVTSRSLSTLP